jgi:hypothetical protein
VTAEEGYVPLLRWSVMIAKTLDKGFSSIARLNAIEFLVDQCRMRRRFYWRTVVAENRNCDKTSKPNNQSGDLRQASLLPMQHA